MSRLLSREVGARRRWRLATVVSAWVFVAAALPATASLLTVAATVEGGPLDVSTWRALWLPLVALLAAAALMAFAVARHIAQPLVRLRAVAALVARSRPEPSVVDRALKDESYTEVAAVLSALQRLIVETEREAEDRDRLAAFVAHDLRTPLSAVARVLEATNAADRSEEDLAHARSELLWAVAELDRLVVALRAQPVHEEGERSVEVGALVREVARLFDGAKTRIACSVQRDFGAAVPRQALRTVLQNLLENAERHGPGSCRVEVDLGRIRVQNLRRVLGEGADSSETVALRHGLGLEIARSTLDRIGGRMVIEPTGDHVFAVTVYVPMVKPS